MPGELPETLAGVPRAPAEAKPFVEDTCEGLRNDLRTRTLYMERAGAVEAELNLPELCRGIEDLGQKDTFSFEERTFLKRAIDGLIQDNSDQTREVLNRQATSVWLGKGESHVYDRFVGDHLKERGKKIAYLMVDALRYELGVALEKLISEDGQVELQPTVTPVGMASLLPGAQTDLFLEVRRIQRDTGWKRSW